MLPGRTTSGKSLINIIKNNGLNRDQAEETSSDTTLKKLHLTPLFVGDGSNNFHRL